MSEYYQNAPHPGQQQDSSNLVDNPRYQGQSTGTAPDGITGPQQESRYGATPLSSTGSQQQGQQHVQQHGTGQGGYGAPPTTGGYGSDPNAQRGYGSQTTGGYGGDANPQAGYGSQTTSGYGSHHNPQAGYGSQPTGGYGADPNARGTQSGYGSQPTSGGYGTQQGAGFVDHNTRPDQAGYGSQPTGGYGTHHQQGVSEFAREQPGYGQPGFGAPSEGQHTGALWPEPAAPPNAYKHDLTSQGQGGYGQQHPGQGQGPYGQQQPGQGQSPYGQGAYDQQPRKEGVVDKVKDAVGVGPWSQGAAPGQGYNPNVNHPSEEAGFGGGHGHHPHGGHDQLAGGYNTGTATGGDPYTQSQPRKEGLLDKAKDAVGMGPRSHGAASGQEYNPNVNHPSEETGYGGGHGHHTHGGHDQLGGGYNTGSATGADAYTQSQPRKEGLVDKAKDAVGMGPNSGYDARTQTGNDAYVHGNHPAGLQDRVQGVNEPTFLGGEHTAGRKDGARGQGEVVPESLFGETRTEPGYDASKGHLPGHGEHHQKLGETGLGGHHNTGTDTGTATGADTYGTESGTGYDDTSSGTAPPKKGLISKIKEKLHQ